eukprot:EG_transcript_17841
MEQKMVGESSHPDTFPWSKCFTLGLVSQFVLFFTGFAVIHLYWVQSLGQRPLLNEQRPVRSQFPGRHQDGEIPGDDLSHNTNGFMKGICSECLINQGTSNFHCVSMQLVCTTSIVT